MQKSRYAYYDINFIQDIPVSEVLQSYGIPVKQSKFALRSERTPSCKLYSDNHWYDYGSHVGGKAVELVMNIDGVSYKEAVQELGERYNAPTINIGIQNSNTRFLSESNYNSIGLVGSATYKNILKPEYAQRWGYNEVLEIKEKYNIPMNSLWQKDPTRYTQIIQSEALPFVKNLHHTYLRSLLTLHKAHFQYLKESNDFKLSEHFAKEIHSEYADAYKVLAKALKGSDLKLPSWTPNYEKDLLGIMNKSIEIGEFPYSSLKETSEPLSHQTISSEAYDALNKAMNFDELQLPPFSAHIKGNDVTVSFSAKHSNIFASICNTLTKVTELHQKQVPQKQHAQYDLEL